MDRQLSPESKAELAQLRAQLHANDGEALRYDEEKRRFFWYVADATDHYPERLAGFSPDEIEQEQLRRELDERATLAQLHRDPADAEVLRRWNQPDDVLAVFDHLDETKSRGVWVEAMTDHRRRELHGLLRAYFGTEDYADREIVLRWKRRGGRWSPAEKANVIDWINAKIEERGSMLAGFASCAGTIRQKLQRRRAA